MNLGDVVELEGIKILDTTAFSPVHKYLLQGCYDCRTPDLLPMLLLEEYTEQKRVAAAVLQRPDVFTLEEVAMEEGVFMNKLGCILSYYQKNTRKHNKATKRGMDLLGMLGKDTSRLTKIARKNNLLKHFSQEEKQMYEGFLEYFREITRRLDIERDYTRRHNPGLKSHNPCKFETDQKIVAAACTQAQSQPTLIISSDSDISRMLKIVQKERSIPHLERLGVRMPPHEILLYSRFNEDSFSLQKNSYIPSCNPISC